MCEYMLSNSLLNILTFIRLPIVSSPRKRHSKAVNPGSVVDPVRWLTQFQNLA